MPLWQYLGLEQRGEPHAPQLALSVMRSAQYVPQSVVPATAQTQVPPLHVLSVPQVFPHSPQFEVLVDVSTQTPLQSVFPTSQRQKPP